MRTIIYLFDLIFIAIGCVIIGEVLNLKIFPGLFCILFPFYSVLERKTK